MYIASPTADMEVEVVLTSRNPIASGGFADVREGVLVRQGPSAKVAVKIFRVPHSSQRIAVRIQREAAIWSQLRHPHILPFIGYARGGDDELPRLVSPMCANGNAAEYLKSHPEIDPWRILLQTAEALEFMHDLSPPIVHGDIKGNNVLISDSGDALVGDFGLSHILNDSGISSGLTTAQNAFGCVSYMSPEMLSGAITKPTPACDCYAFGSLCFELVTGRLPYFDLHHPAQVIKKVSEGARTTRPAKPRHPLSDCVWEILCLCWNSADFRPHIRIISAELRAISSNTSSRASSRQSTSSARDSSPTLTNESGDRASSLAPSSVSSWDAVGRNNTLPPENQVELPEPTLGQSHPSLRHALNIQTYKSVSDTMSDATGYLKSLSGLFWGSSAVNLGLSPLGFEELASGGEHPSVDIIAVHGINGHRIDTWTSGGGAMWLRDFLPQDMPQARVLTYGFDARTHGKGTHSTLTLHQHATSFLADLCIYRGNDPRRPLIFVCHSLGGILVKQALISANHAGIGHQEDYKAIKFSTAGILFFGTPHQGGYDLELSMIVQRAAIAGPKMNNILLKNITVHSEWLDQQLDQFVSIAHDFETKFFFEEYETLVEWKKILVVPRWSAVLPQRDAEALKISSNHTDMVKFQSKSDAGYNTVIYHLKRIADRAPTKVAANWVQWDTVASLTHREIRA